jgi:uncharacterized membrane protein YsdA (DUF1294 family)
MRWRNKQFRFLIILLLLPLGFTLLLGQLLGWDPLLIWLPLINLVTFAAYRYDKQIAEIRPKRIPEFNLLLPLYVGGAVGGWLGMHRRPRHKTNKLRFNLSVWLGLAILLVGSLFYFGLL